jgi:hypothetical protein
MKRPKVLNSDTLIKLEKEVEQIKWDNNVLY